MCGISGFLLLGPGADQAVLRARLNKQIDAIRHRGPDDRGVWTDGVAGLGHARLSIIDLSPAGHQPMTTTDSKFWIVFNGEIYNFQEIRAELQAKGVSFKSNSDTECILEGYRVWGDAVLDRLRGMFALALWDPGRQRLLLARDRLGKKPLYWAKIGNAVVFGSELKAVVAWPGLDRSPDYSAIHQYLTYQYIPAPLTIFSGVKKLPAACKMVVERGPDGQWNVGAMERYWRLPTPNARPASQFDAKAEQERFLELFRESVRLRMISDVPLGAFLSGGVDSSAVVAMMAMLSDKPVKTFSIGSPHKEYDETKYARMVAERYGTDHEELILEPNAAEILPRLIWHYNEPYADASMIPTYYVSKMAREHVTVALNGDGGDEALIGYPRYDTVRGLSEFDMVPPALAPFAIKAVNALPGSLREAHADKLNRFLNAMVDRQQPNSRRYAFTIVSIADSQKEEAYGPAMRPYLESSALNLLDQYFDAAPDFVSGANWADTHVYLPDDLMVKVDVASMSVSLESRSPLLDHKLMEWAFSLPQSVKTPGNISKGLFKRAMEPYLPHDLLYRPKMGFGCPIDHWLRADLKEIAYDVLLSDTAANRGIVERSYVKRMLDEHVSMVNAHHTRLFALLNMELWFRMWSDQSVDAALERPELGAKIGAVSTEERATVAAE